MDDYHTGIAFLISLGAFIGFINGLIGMAGTATFVSAMLIGLPHFFGIDGPDVAKIALASAVGLIVPTAIASTQANASRGAVDWWQLAWFTPSVLAGAFVASAFVFALSARLLMIVLAVVVLMTAWQMLAGERERAPRVLMLRRPQRFALTWRGVLGGALSTLLALSASFFAVPLLSRHLPRERAIGTAMALSIPLAIAGVTGYLLAPAPGECKGMCAGYIFLPAVAAAGIGAVLMAPLGAALARHLPKRPLRRLWGLWLLVVAGHIVSCAFDPAHMARVLRSGVAEARQLMERAEVALWPDAARPAAPDLPRWMAVEQAPYFALVTTYGPQRAFLPLLITRDETGPQAARALFARIQRNRPNWFASEAIREEIAVALATIKEPAPIHRAAVASGAPIAAADKPPLPSRRKGLPPRPGPAKTPIAASAGVAKEAPVQIFLFGQ